MPRGKESPIGTEMVNQLGYTQVKTERGWVGKHTLVLEKKLGRQLVSGERATFKDKDKTNFKPDNIQLATSGNAKTIEARIARYEAEIKDREEWIADLKSQLAQR